MCKNPCQGLSQQSSQEFLHPNRVQHHMTRLELASHLLLLSKQMTELCELPGASQHPCPAAEADKQIAGTAVSWPATSSPAASVAVILTLSKTSSPADQHTFLPACSMPRSSSRPHSSRQAETSRSPSHTVSSWPSRPPLPPLGVSTPLSGLSMLCWRPTRA